MSLETELQNIQTDVSLLKNNKVSRFAYDSTAYMSNSANSPQYYSWAQHNNIPSDSLDDTKISDVQRDKGFRVKQPVLSKLFIDHFFGRASYNLNKVIDFVESFLAKVGSNLGVSNGLATLDSSRRIPSSQVSESLMTYKGTWNAFTNTPTLANGVGEKGDLYYCSVGGTVNFGAGDIVFEEGERVVYNGTTWQQIPLGDLKTVSEIGITTNGNINLSQQTDITKVLNQRVLNGLLWWQQE